MKFFRNALVLLASVTLLAIATVGCTGPQGPEGPTGPQGLEGPAGPNMIVAMGSVDQNGDIAEASNVASVTWNGSMGWWEITLTDIDYLTWDYITIVSCRFRSGFEGYATHSSVSGQLLIRTLDSGGNPVQEGFSFVVIDVEAP